MSKFRATVGTMAFEGGPMLGDGFSLETITGWLSAPDMRRESRERQQAHGVMKAPGYLDQRLIVLEGKCFTTNAETQGHMAARLSGLLADGGYGRLTVEHEGTTLWADVGLQSQDFDITLYGQVAEYQIQFLAPDPFRYGETHTYGPAGPLGEIPVFHYGNAKAYPRFSVAGTISEDYAVYGPGTGDTRKRFKVNGTVSSGHPNVIDLKTGIVKVDGIQRRGVIEDATTWGVPGGTTISHTLDSNGDPATLTVTITDTYS